MWRIGVGFSAMPNLRKAFIRVANVLKITRRQPQIPLDAGFAKVRLTLIWAIMSCNLV